MSALLASWVLVALAAGAETAPGDTKKVATKEVTKLEQRNRQLAEERELLRLFADTLEQVKANYVDGGISERELIEAAIEGMVSKLDPYSNYIPPEDLEQFRRGMEPYAGVGIEVTKRNGYLLINRAMFGYSAWRSGLRGGDRILKIGDQNVKDLTVNKAVELVSGADGTEVEVTVFHPETRRTEILALKREIVQRPTVLGFQRESNGQWEYYCEPEQKIAYIRVTTFGRNTSKDLAKTLERLKTGGMRALVLDLRFNPGGLLTEAIQACELFIADGKIVSTEGRNTPSHTWRAHKKGTLLPAGFPVAVLVNRFSASAAEIVSACLQDHKAAVVVGERTWGKGSVQNVIALEHGRSALKLTTAGYMRPSGKNIHRRQGATPEDDWGVRPDNGYQIRYSDVELIRLGNLLRRRESPAQVAKDAKPTADEADENAESKPDEKANGTKAQTEKPAGTDRSSEGVPAFVDRQLLKAIDYVRDRLSDKKHQESAKSES